MKVFVLLVCLALCLIAAGCSGQTEDSGTKADPEGSESEVTSGSAGDYTLNTKVTDVMNDPVFGDYGRLIFPVDRTISEDLELQDVGDILVWYNNVNPDRTVEITNYLKDQAASGEQIFYDIYTDEEKSEDPEKEDTGLFFFRGDPGAQTACEDLARAIAFLHENAEELQIDISDYSLWGGSAGARMAAWLGSYGTAAFGEVAYPAPGAVIMQYTGLSEVTGNEPPTYACVGTRDGIAAYRSMENYISRIQADGTDARIEVFDGLGHGFGLGEGTVAEGWINNAVDFWEQNME